MLPLSIPYKNAFRQLSHHGTTKTFCIRVRTILSALRGQATCKMTKTVWSDNLRPELLGSIPEHMVSWSYKGRTDESWSEFLILDDSNPFRFRETCRGLCFPKSSFRAGISSTVTPPQYSCTRRNRTPNRTVRKTDLEWSSRFPRLPAHLLFEIWVSSRWNNTCFFPWCLFFSYFRGVSTAAKSGNVGLDFLICTEATQNHLMTLSNIRSTHPIACNTCPPEPRMDAPNFAHSQTVLLQICSPHSKVPCSCLPFM